AHRIYLEYRNADDRYRGEDPQKHLTMNHLLDNMPEYLRAKFWSDGMIRVSGREYSGLIASPCFDGGHVSCLSCHTMHRGEDDPRPLKEWANDQLTPEMAGDQACLGCHPQFSEPEALTAHTHHAPESTGSGCYDCHMPFTSYGILKAHRSHMVDSPSVAVSLATGRPNACNLCHLDRTLAWTAEHLEARYDIPGPELDADRREIAASALWALRGDAGLRVLIAWHMGWEPAREVSGSDWMVPILKELMLDPYDAVRFVAGRSMGRHEGYGDVAYDYVAGDAHLAQAAAGIDAIWASLQRRSRGRTLLQDAAGGLDAELFARLLSERDHRPVSLNE
ncbi:MAG: multiheme c-type cytochrome, partial [Myxococcota bacterium]